MSALDAYYRFEIELSHPDTEQFVHLRFKTPKFLDETFDRMFARILAYCHAYSPGLELYGQRAGPEELSISRLNALGEIEAWIEVGGSSRKRIERSIRLRSVSDRRVYFFEEHRIEEFVKELRGSVENWIAPVSFLILPAALISELSAQQERHAQRGSAVWTLSILDNQIYLDANGSERSGAISVLDMWQRYQSSIGNATCDELGS